MKNFFVSVIAILTLSFLFFFAVMPPRARAESFPGLTEAYRTVTLYFQTDGVIQSVEKKDGAYCKDGGVIAVLDNRKQRSLVAQAEAKLKSAKATLKGKKEDLIYAQSVLKRKENLKSVISENELESARHDAVAKEAEEAVWEDNVLNAKAELALRRSQLEDTRLVAPFSGWLGEIKVVSGKSVKAFTTPVTDIYDINKIYVRVSIPSELYHTFQNNPDVSIRINTGSGENQMEYKALSMYVDPAIDPRSSTFTVKFTIDNPKNIIRPGMSAEVTCGEKDLKKGLN